MSMNEKSELSKLYYCDNVECKVVTFKGEVCPGCGNDGILVREPTASRLGLARK